MKNIIKLFLLLAFFCWLPSTVCIAEVTYYHTDNLGTPMAMTDSTGKVVWQGDFYPFGEECQIQATPNKNKRRFTGKEKDEESVLHYFGSRYMDEASGRFVSPDPVTAVDAQTSKINTALLGNPLRLNRYVYGLDNPYRYIDPDGNVSVLLMALAGAAISYLSAPDVANAPKSSSSQTFQSHGGGSIVAGAVGGAGLHRVATMINISNKGMITPKKYFGDKTEEAAVKALTRKKGPPTHTPPGKKIWFDQKGGGRSTVVHKESGHGPPHVDITTRKPGIKPRKYPLKRD